MDLCGFLEDLAPTSPESFLSGHGLQHFEEVSREKFARSVQRIIYVRCGHGFRAMMVSQKNPQTPVVATCNFDRNDVLYSKICGKLYL